MLGWVKVGWLPTAYGLVVPLLVAIDDRIVDRGVPCEGRETTICDGLVTTV